MFQSSYSIDMDIASFLVDSEPWTVDLALLLGRVALGVCFVIHALGKLGVFGSGGIPAFARWLESLHVPWPTKQAWAATLSELLGGIAMALGLFMRPACGVLAMTMIAAGVLGHRGAGYLITNDPPGAEYTINLAVICVMFALLGPGQYSIDALLVALIK